MGSTADNPRARDLILAFLASSTSSCFLSCPVRHVRCWGLSYLLPNAGSSCSQVVWTEAWGCWRWVQGHRASAGSLVSISYPLLWCWAKLERGFKTKSCLFCIGVWESSVESSMWDAMAQGTPRNSQVKVVIRGGKKNLSSMAEFLEQAENNFRINISVL